MVSRDELIQVLRSVIGEAFPEQLHGMPYAVRGTVLRVYAAAGRMGEDEPPRYAADVRMIDRSGQVRDDLPPLTEVEIPVLWAGQQRGIYCLPPVGATVRVGFDYADPSRPYVDAVLGDGFEAPAHVAGSLLIQQADGTKIEIDAAGYIRVATGGAEVLLEPADAAQGRAAHVTITAPGVTVTGNLVVTGTINGV